MKVLRAAAALVVAWCTLPLWALPMGVAGEPSIPGLSVTTDVSFVGASFVLTDDIVVQSGGRLTLDNTTVLVRISTDQAFGIRVRSGGELVIVNNSRIASTFESVGFVTHYSFFVEPGAHLVLRDSTVDAPWAFGVGDESAVLENITIANGIFGLYGSNLTVTGARFLGNNIGFWLSGHSVMRDIVGRNNLVYGGILDGTSRLEGGSFTDSVVADLVLNNASSANTTHHRSARGIVVNGDVEIDNMSASAMAYGAVQLGYDDYGFGCGAFYGPIPPSDWLNLHMLPYYFRLNNTLQLADLEVDGAPGGIVYGRQVWRELEFVNQSAPVINTCGDPPDAVPGAPLWNNIAWVVNRPAAVRAERNDFNGSVEVRPGASLRIDGGALTFISQGEGHRLTASGDSLTLQGVHMRSAWVNYSGDALEFGRDIAPGIDLDVQAGSLLVDDSHLQNLGVTTDLSVASGLIVREGAGPIQVSSTAVDESWRGLVLGCCAPSGPVLDGVRLEEVTFGGIAPAVELWNARVEIYNSTLGNGTAPSIRASAGASHASLFSTSGAPSGPSPMTIDRLGPLQARVVWPDQRPVAGASFVAVDTVDLQESLNVSTDARGWTLFSFVRYSSGTWDGAVELAGSPHPFMLVASYRNVSATLAPVDISQPSVLTLTLPDEGAPLVNLSMPAVTFTNRNSGTINGSAEDFETGVSLVEVAIDAGGYARVTPPGPPAEGPLNFSADYSGLANGIHVISFRAWDTVGNSALASVLVVVDPLAPSVSLDYAFNFTTKSREFNISGRLSEPGTVVVGNQTAVVTEDNLRFSIPFRLVNDSEIILLVVTDVAGNFQAINLVARLDEVPPVLTLTSPADGAFVTSADLLLRGTVEPTATVYLNGVRLGIGGSSSFSIPAILSEGENALTLRAVDQAGNEATLSFTVYLDTGLPPLDVLAPDAAEPLARSAFELVLRTEVGAVVAVAGLNVTATDSIVTIPLSLPDGRNSVPIEVTDRGGNVVRRVITVVVDTRVPALSVSGGDGQRTTNETFRLLGQTEPGAFVRIGQWESQADDAGVFALNVRLHPGENELTIVAWDEAGNQASLGVAVILEQPDPAAPAGLALPTGGSIALLVVGAVALALAVPVSRRLISLFERKPR